MFFPYHLETPDCETRMFNKIIFLTVLCSTSPTFAQTVFEFPLRPVVNSNRVIGLGGAFVGIGEGADGHTYTPTSFASRYSYSRDQLWDWDWALYWLNLPNAAHQDFANNQSDANSAFHLGLGIDIKYSFFGTGLHAYTSEYRFSDDTDVDYIVNQTVAIFGAAFTIPKLQLTIGAAANSGSGDLFIGDDLVVDFEGSGGSFAALWFPSTLPFRIGVNFRLAQNDDEIALEDETYLFEEQSSVHQPAELTLGGSWMLWEKKYNPKHTFGNVDAEGEAKVIKRRYVLIAADFVTTFASPEDTQSITTLIDGVQKNSGKDVNFALRVGVESEVLANRLTFRTGYYQQPSRLESSPTYHHFTAGADLRITLGLDWKLNTVVDVSKDYLNFGLGVGLWH